MTVFAVVLPEPLIILFALHHAWFLAYNNSKKTVFDSLTILFQNVTRCVFLKDIKQIYVGIRSEITQLVIKFIPQKCNAWQKVHRKWRVLVPNSFETLRKLYLLYHCVLSISILLTVSASIIILGIDKSNDIKLRVV